MMAYTNSTMSHIFRMVCFLVHVWIDQEGRSSKQTAGKPYSFGFARAAVLASFTSAVVLLLLAAYTFKVSLQRAFVSTGSQISSEAILIWTAFAVGLHFLGAYHLRMCPQTDFIRSGTTRAADHHHPNYVKRLIYRLHVTDIRQMAGGINSGIFLVTMLLLFAGAPGIDVIDSLAAFAIALLSAAGVYPIISQNALVLLQTTPQDLTGQLEKCLREVSTFEGVLEFHNEHFWAVSAGELAGSLHVRVRRDANEQAVLAQVANKLAHLVPPRNLTVQIVKDDWAQNRFATPLRSGSAE